jgi:Cu-Zn family superoxide dismutase
MVCLAAGAVALGAHADFKVNINAIDAKGAGPHYDPGKTGKHAGAEGAGHKGDLPPLVADGAGNMKTAVAAPRLKLAELKNRALIIHVGGDNGTDQPANGGGGTRIACDVIK